MSTQLEDPPLRDALAVERRPRLLLVAYNFPPVGGAGVQRPVKWVKNLGQFGWDVTVLTTANPSVPARDESLLADIPDDVLVVRARTWEPGYHAKQGLVNDSQLIGRGILAQAKSAMKRLTKWAAKLILQPDPQVLWVPHALQAGRQLLREMTHDAILVTAPAYSSFFIGTSLKRQFRLPLILDFRDEWDMSGKYLENAQRDLFSRIIQERMQRHVLKCADAVVATTKASTANLAEKLQRMGRSVTPTVTIYNGFDAEDFAHVKPHPSRTNRHSLEQPSKISQRENPCEKMMTQGPSKDGQTGKTFRLLYTGTLWNLTTIEPLVEAVIRLNESSADLVSKLELVCVGRKTSEQIALLQKLRATGCRLELIDYCEHSKILEWLRSTDAVCLLLSDVPGAERVVPAKLFEYLANRKDMLAIVPQGETSEITRRFFPHGCLEPKNIDGIVNWLKDRLSGQVAVDETIPNMDEIEEFSRTTQTARLVELLDQLTRHPLPCGRTIR